MKRILNLMLCATLTLTLICPAQATSQAELNKASAYVREHGIMSGDQNGNLNLSSRLNRAEMAVLLTRLNGGMDTVKSNISRYSQNCAFRDVPAWARPYVSYCAENQLMVGYGNGVFGPSDPVTPAMACTVVLRTCGIADGGGSVWSYNTACAYAVSLGWIDESITRAASITRGDMAILIYRALTNSQQEPQYTDAGYLTNDKPITEENVLELLRQLETEWPAQTPWDDPKLNPDTRRNAVPSAESGKLMRNYRTNGTYGCGGYASMISSLIFGDQTNPCRRVEDLTQIRPGDIIFRVSNTTGKVWHVTVALESPNDVRTYHVTDGNRNGVVYWPDRDNPYGRESLDSYGEGRSHHLEVWTRYPESVPYTGNSVGAWLAEENECT